MSISGKNIIGTTTSASSSETFQAFNPVSGEKLPTAYHVASDDEVDEAMSKAEAAFAIFKNIPWTQRAKFLRRIADEMEALGDLLVETASAETGLPGARIIGERGRTTGQLRMFADHIEEGSWVEARIDTALPDRTPIPKQDIRKMMVPLGPVVVFGASNFPLAYSVAGGDTAAALASGCPVLVKAHPGHPGTSALVGQAIVKAAEATNMPEGVFSLLFDDGYKVGAALVGHPATTAVGFTGSLTGGRALFDIAAKRENPIPVFAEMGSTNPVILLPEAVKSRGASIAEQYAGSITLGVGQFCTKPGLILGVKSDNLSEFASDLATHIQQIAPGTMLHAGISKAYANNRSAMLAEPAVDLLGESTTEATAAQARPTVAKASGKAFIANPKLHEDVFGPFSMIIECDSAQELEEAIATLQGQLTTTVMGDSEDFGAFSEMLNTLRERTGRLIFNGVPTGVEVCPAMQHGGPYPATTDARFTAVGIDSIKRFIRPLSYQSAPQELLPDALKDENPLKIWRLVNGEFTK
jgi:alpha-ketoglutaric semialdehyde dehydrogenase